MIYSKLIIQLNFTDSDLESKNNVFVAKNSFVIRATYIFTRNLNIVINENLLAKWVTAKIAINSVAEIRQFILI